MVVVWTCVLHKLQVVNFISINYLACCYNDNMIWNDLGTGPLLRLVSLEVTNILLGFVDISNHAYCGVCVCVCVCMVVLSVCVLCGFLLPAFLTQ